MDGLYWVWRVWLANPTMLDVKAWVAGLGAAVLMWYFLADLLPTLRRGKRARDILLGALGILSFCCWFNLFRFHFEPFIHYYEFYHYYLGAKYTPELQYTHIYECTVVAEAEYAPYLRPALERITIRDLKTNELMLATEALNHPERCKDRFTAERWHDFMRDSDYFRRASNWGYWSFALNDNGFNGTPVWALFAGPLANSGNIDDTMLFRLGYLDPALLTLMWLVCCWAFGWRTTCVALIFWGTNYAGRYYWNGGAFLRMDWLFCIITAIACLKKGRPATAGVLATLATLLRVFPGFAVVPLVLKVIVESWRARKLVIGRVERRFAVAAAITIVVLVPLATWRNGGPEIWKAFVENSRKHLDTPLTNNMGLKAIYAWAPHTRALQLKEPAAVDPFHRWKLSQRLNFEHHRVLFVLSLAAFLALLAMAAARQEHWVAMVLGCGFVLVAAELTCYYFSIFLALGFLWPRVKWAGWALALASVLSLVLPNLAQLGRLHWRLRMVVWDDDAFVLISAVWLILVVALTYEMARPLWSRSARTAPAPTSAAKSAA
jgi:hypothetical protein